MNWDAFLDTYVRPNNSTKIVIVSHTSCAGETLVLLKACCMRNLYPEVVLVTEDGAYEQDLVARELGRNIWDHIRRIVAIVVEPQGPSFTSVLAQGPKGPSFIWGTKRVPMTVFRATAESMLGATQ